MKNKLSIIISHYNPDQISKLNPLHKTLKIIKQQKESFDFEVIIADDGSFYSKAIINSYSEKINIKNDLRDVFVLESKKLNLFLKKLNIDNDLISKWVYLPKYIKCMSKARVLNHAAKLSNGENLLFLDDDNYFISSHSIKNLIVLFKKYNFIVGQIKDNNGRTRSFNSKRVQGTTIAINKEIFKQINGFGEWTEKFSCGVDSDFWIKVHKYFTENIYLKACYTNKISTYDSYSKRWKKYTKIFQDFRLNKEFKRIYSIANYKNAKYNLSRNKKLWIKNLINNE